MNKRALTLMEVIIAALILALTVGGTLYIFSTEKGVVARTGRAMQAIDFAQQTLEELKNAVSADTWPDAGVLAPGGPFSGDDIADGAFKEKFEGTRSYTVTNIDADSPQDGVIDYKEVTVTVDWEEPAETQ